MSLQTIRLGYAERLPYRSHAEFVESDYETRRPIALRPRESPNGLKWPVTR